MGDIQRIKFNRIAANCILCVGKISALRSYKLHHTRNKFHTNSVDGPISIIKLLYLLHGFENGYS